jgi:predicted protein tyrosine phosphatase
MPKLKILFLCTGNSCRSQMAEGWARFLKSDWIEPYSAGIETHGLNPMAVKVMAEVGVDISSQMAKHLNALIEGDCVRHRHHSLRLRERFLPVLPREDQADSQGFRPSAETGEVRANLGRSAGSLPQSTG